MRCTLKLDKKTELTAGIPPVKKFTHDELEVWCLNGRSRVCIFRDSYYDVFLREPMSAIKGCREARPCNKDESGFVSRLIRRYETSEEDRELYEHILFTVGNWVTWLFWNDENVILWLTYIRPYMNRRFKCTRVKRFVVDKAAFLKWYDSCRCFYE